MTHFYQAGNWISAFKDERIYFQVLDVFENDYQGIDFSTFPIILDGDLDKIKIGDILNYGDIELIIRDITIDTNTLVKNIISVNVVSNKNDFLNIQIGDQLYFKWIPKDNYL